MRALPLDGGLTAAGRRAITTGPGPVSLNRASDDGDPSHDLRIPTARPATPLGGTPSAATACACGFQRPGPGETNRPQPSTASPRRPVRSCPLSWCSRSRSVASALEPSGKCRHQPSCDHRRSQPDEPQQGLRQQRFEPRPGDCVNPTGHTTHRDAISAATACPCRFQQPSPGETNQPRPSTTSPHRPLRSCPPLWCSRSRPAPSALEPSSKYRHQPSRDHHRSQPDEPQQGL
ncbi:hypothetical protein a10_08297 [Streptomyces acidiscabies]|nr:hypothetical protein a10_08297 [Streptomyces acidiscabies]GAV45208.1 hypothetical protein Saa2_08194 [Streptomyces acidiscabies]